MIETALSDSAQQLVLYKVGCGGKAGLTNTKQAWEKLSINSQTGDAVLGELDQVSLIKIDVDGFDMPVIRGLRQTIEKHRPVVQFEYGRYWIKTRNYLGDAFEFFAELDYSVGRLMPKGIHSVKYSHVHENFLNCNFVARPIQPRQ